MRTIHVLAPTARILKDEAAIQAMRALHDRFDPGQAVAVSIGYDDRPDGFLVAADSLQELRRLACLYPQAVCASHIDAKAYPIYYHLSCPVLTREELHV